LLVRIQKSGTPTPVTPARIASSSPAAPSSGPGSFSSTAEEAALALQIEQDLMSGTLGRGGADAQKDALASIDDIAARNSLNIVERKKPGQDNRDKGNGQA
jgi:hypothetical protein